MWKTVSVKIDGSFKTDLFLCCTAFAIIISYLITSSRFWAPGPDADFIDNLRYFRGFVQLQDLIDKAIISTRLSSADLSAPVAGSAGVVKRDTSWAVGLDPAINDSRVEDWAVYTQQMPYACWVKDEYVII